MSTTINTILRRTHNKNQEHKILIRVYSNKKTTDISTKHSVSKELFDSARQKVKPSHPRSERINYELAKFKQEIQGIILDLKDKYKILDIKMIKKVLKGESIETVVAKQNPTYSEYFREHMHLNPDNLSYGTLKYYRTTVSRWDEVFKEVLLKDVSDHHIIAYRSHLQIKGNKINTIHTRLKTLRKVLHTARRAGLIAENPFRDIKLECEEGEREYLEQAELDKLITYIPKNDSEKLVQDLFIFSCFTGIRFSDLCTLTKDNFRVNGAYVKIKFRMQKTKDMLEFNLANRAKVIYLKYLKNDYEYLFNLIKNRNSDSTEDIKRAISSYNAYANTVIKDIISSIGVTKPISIHCSRHTFAVLSIEKGADLYSLSQMMGHKDITTTQLYAKLADSRKQELTDLWNE